MNTLTKQNLIDEGIHENRIEVVYGGADATLIRSKKRSSRNVAIISRCSDRKNPMLISKVIKMMPHINFLVIGDYWEKNLPNVHNVKFLKHDYQNMGNILNNVDVFFSASTLEGGPIPLLEAMFTNAVPVCSKTGFAPDIIEHGVNGFLFNTNDNPKYIANLLTQAFDHKGDCAESVKHFTWENFAKKIIFHFEY